jgi:hypothetical protein
MFAGILQPAVRERRQPAVMARLGDSPRQTAAAPWRQRDILLDAADYDQSRLVETTWTVGKQPSNAKMCGGRQAFDKKR